MQLLGRFVSALVASALVFGRAEAGVEKTKHHHHKHHKHHRKGLATMAAANNVASPAVVKTNSTSTAVEKPPVAQQQPIAAAAAAEAGGDAAIVAKMKNLETQLAAHESAQNSLTQSGKIEVNAPLPADFSERFAQAAAAAADVNPMEVTVTGVQPLGSNLAEVVFKAPVDVVRALEGQAADPKSKFANGIMHDFLLAKDDQDAADVVQTPAAPVSMLKLGDEEGSEDAPTPVVDKSLDIDTAMPYGELEPFGREDTAQELTESSVKESDEMVDQVERAEVAEEKRAVFRALTRLRGAAITSFDGVARSQTGNIDEYNKVHKWRSTHPLHHLADEESDISKWAFPDNADF